MNHYIQIKKKYLIFRDDAKKLEKLIRRKLKENSSKTIFLDFSPVAFLSRSFIDEFLNKLDILVEEGAEVKLVHLKLTFQRLIANIKKTKEKIKREVNGFHKIKN